MMRKLPKQHILWLALALVWVWAFLGIQISDVANQQTYAWSTNEDRLDQDFWDNDWTPGNSAQIINTVYGDGIGQTDETRYSKYWTQHICDPNTMNVVYINSGTNNVPDTLLGNTIYVLEAGPHIKTGTVTMPDDCTAIIGQKTNAYTTGALLQFSGNFLTGLYIDDATNIVVGQILFQPPTLWWNTVGTAIHTKNMDSSTIYVGEVRYYYNQWVLIEWWSNIYYNNYANYGNPYGTVVTWVNDIMIGESTGQRFSYISLNQTWLLINNSQNIQLYADTAYNYQAGAHITNSSGITFNGRYYDNNYGDGVIIENSTGIVFNKWQIHNPTFSANGWYGLYMKNVSGVTGNGLFAIGNTTFEGYGLYMDNVTNLYLSNVVISANVRNGIHITWSQSISLINASSTGNGNNGIQTIDTNNLLMSGWLISGNQNHGVFLDQWSSGNIIKWITSRVNTLAGVYIANGASYNTLQSSNIPQNGQNGVIILDSQYNVITGVTATGTVQSAGILLFGTATAYNTVSHSLAAYANNGIGIMIFLGHDNIVEYSEAHSNNGAWFGIAGDNISWMVGADNNIIRYSTSHNNIGYAGFGLTMDISGNILHDIVAYENGDDGISISDTPYTNYIQNLRAYDNIGNGIQILQAQGTHVTTWEVSGNTSHGISIEDSRYSRIHNIKAYANDMHGVHLIGNANNNQLSFIQTYDNWDNGIQITNSEDNLFENIVGFDNGNDWVHIEFKSANNTFYDAQLYNNRIWFRQEAGENTRLLNALVYNNSMAWVALEGGLSSVNNAAIYNNTTWLISKRAGNVINNVDIYNNDYGVSIVLAAIPSDLIFNNVSVYNNTFGIATSTTQGNTYNGLHMFDNSTNFVWTNGNDAQLQPSSYPWAPTISNNLTDTWSMTCNWAIQSTNNLSQNLLVYPYCNTRGQIGWWTPTLAVQYTFFPYIYKQNQPVGHDSMANIVSTGTFVSGMFVGDAVYTGYTDFWWHMNLTNEVTTYASGWFTYRYDNGPFDIEMNANTGTTKWFVVTGVNDIIWNGVPWPWFVGPFAGLQYTLGSQYLVPWNGLKIFRAGYDIAGQWLVSNYYGQIRWIAAPVCGNSILEWTEECDDMNGWCNLTTCTLYTGSCSIQANPATWDAPLNVAFNGIWSTGFLFDYIDYGDGTTGNNLIGHTYNIPGTYTITVYEYNYSSGSIISTCSDQIQVNNATYCGNGVPEANEQCDDGNSDNYDGCSNQCTTNTCVTSYQTILEPKFAFVATWWTGDRNIDINFVSTTLGSGLIYNWSVGQFSWYNGITWFNLSGWNIVWGTSSTWFALHISTLNTPYHVEGTIHLNVSNGSYSSDVQLRLICADNAINDASPWCYLYSAYQEVQSFSGLTLTLDDRSIGQIISQTGYIQTVNQYSDTWFNDLIPKRWYRDYPTMTPVTSLTWVNASWSHMYASWYGIVKPYFTRGLTYLTEPDLRKDYTYQQSVFSYTNSCFSVCGNGVPEANEQCDDGNLIDGDGCGSVCTIDPFLCSQITNFATWGTPFTFTPIANPPLQTYRFHSYNISRGNGISESGRQWSPNTYTGVGTYTGNVNFNYYGYAASGAAWLDINCPFVVQTVNMCGNGSIDTVGGITTSGTIDYVISSSIAMLTGYDAYDNTYLTWWISVYGATLSTGTAVSYQWTFSWFSTWWANTGFIVGSSTWSTVSIFDDADGIDSDLEWTLTLEITNAQWNVVSTQSYLILDFDTVAIIGIGVGTITISWSQVTYSDYEIYVSSVQNGWTTILTTSGSWDNMSGNDTSWAWYDRYNDGIYDYTEQGTGQIVSYTYANITGNVITTNVSFFGGSGLSVGTQILENPGGMYQSYVFSTTPESTVGASAERCDDGNLIDGDGCSSTCDMENPSCNWFTTTAQTWNAPHDFTISVLPNIYTTGYTFNAIQWMVGVVGSATGNIFTNNTYAYTGAGSYTARVRVSAPAGPQAQVGNTLNCSRPVTVTAACGNGIVDGSYTQTAPWYIQDISSIDIYAITGYANILTWIKEWEEFSYTGSYVYTFAAALTWGQTAASYSWTLTPYISWAVMSWYILWSSTGQNVQILSDWSITGYQEGLLNITILTASWYIIQTQAWVILHANGIEVSYLSLSPSIVGTGSITYTSPIWNTAGMTSPQLAPSVFVQHYEEVLTGAGGAVYYDWENDETFDAYLSGSVTHTYTINTWAVVTNILFPKPEIYQNQLITFVQSGTTYVAGEQCDDGNTNDNDGCDSQCNFEIPQTCSWSDNLVPNPWFESYTQCPTSYGQFSGYVASWFGSLGWDPDYGHANCAYGTSAMFSYIDQYPNLGSSGMVNILTYSSNIPNGGVEYVWATLTAPMQIGNYYDVWFCFATHSRSNYITDRLWMLFSTGTSPTNIGFQPILETPQFEHIGYTQGSGWTCVSGSIYADQAYTSFLLGSFHTNTGQNMVPNPLYTWNGLNYEVANYVIDDVFVSPICATCGDAILDIGEECDLWTGNGSGNGCNSMCRLDPFQCAQITNYATGYAPLSFSPNSPLNLMNLWYGYNLNRWDGIIQSNRSGNAHTYTGVGSYTGSVSLTYTGLTNTGNIANFNVTCPFNVTTIGTRCGNGNIDTYSTGSTGSIIDISYVDIQAYKQDQGSGNRAGQTQTNTPQSTPKPGQTSGSGNRDPIVQQSGSNNTGQDEVNQSRPRSGEVPRVNNLPKVGAPNVGLPQPGSTQVSGDIAFIAMLSGGQTPASYAWTINLSNMSVYTGVTWYIVWSSTGQIIYINTTTVPDVSNGTQLRWWIQVDVTTTAGNIISTRWYFNQLANGDRYIIYPSSDMIANGSQVAYDNYYLGFAGNWDLVGTTSFYTYTGITASQMLWSHTIWFDRSNNGTYSFVGGNVVHNYNLNWSTITTDLSFMSGRNPWVDAFGDIYRSVSIQNVVSTGTSVTEQCDDGNQNNNDGCSNSCQRAQPSCALLLTPSAGTYPLNVLFSLNMSPGSSLIHINYGDGTTGTSVTGHTYTTGGLFAPTAYIRNTANTWLTAICPANTVITITNGYTPACGNQKLEWNEQCDDGNTNSGDECSAQCIFEIPQTCGLSGNLVPNPWFESYIQYSTNFSQFTWYAASWYAPSPDPDYMNLGSPFGSWILNAMRQRPRTGSGVAHILTYASNITGAGREYIGAQLVAPMQIGKRYNVWFCYATHAISNYISDKIGILFSTGTYPTNTGFAAIIQTPQFEHTWYIVWTWWTCVSGTILADKAYERFTIGSFHNNSWQGMIPNPMWNSWVAVPWYDYS
jgi:cysteine-rich repeat protein